MDIWQYLEIAGVAIGLLYLYFEYQASVWLWLTGIIMPAIYIFVYYESGFYADMGINIYYLFAGFYGWASWIGRSRKKPAVSGTAAAPEATPALATELNAAAGLDPATIAYTTADVAVTPEFAPQGASETASPAAAAITAGAVPETLTAAAAMPITRTPARFWLPLSLITIVFFAVISYILIKFTDSTVPLGDSFTTALSIVALWMLARKYVEQWLVWIVVDVICSGLYLYKGLYLTGALFALYSVIAVFGYLKWLRMMKEGK